MEQQACQLDELETLGDKIVILAAHIAAATYRMLVMIAEFDEREGWKAGGHKNCAAWLAFRTGFDAGACREKVRAARALRGLPQIGDAMARGELSFAKVRALTRVATADNEEALLDFASGATAAQTERLVRSWKRMCRDDEAEWERGCHARRCLSVFPDGDGMFRIQGTLDPEVGALLMRAIEAASDALYRTDRRGDADEAAGDEIAGDETVSEVTPEQRRADAMGLLAERAMSAGFASDDAHASRGSRAERYQVMLHVELDTLDGTAGPGLSELSDGSRVSAETSRRIACDAGLVQITRKAAAKDQPAHILNVGRRTRTIPPAIRRALDVRDGGCRFPRLRVAIHGRTPHRPLG